MTCTSIYSVSGARNTRKTARHRERGVALIEFALVLIPLLALMLLIMDVGWVVFAQAAIQEGAREGVRFGITGQLQPGCAGLDCSIEKVVVQYSFGFANSKNITVSYYSPESLADVTGKAGATAGGNIVRVTITNVTVRSLGPIWRKTTPLVLAATAADAMEAKPIVTPE